MGYTDTNPLASFLSFLIACSIKGWEQSSSHVLSGSFKYSTISGNMNVLGAVATKSKCCGTTLLC